VNPLRNGWVVCGLGIRGWGWWAVLQTATDTIYSDTEIWDTPRNWNTLILELLWKSDNMDGIRIAMIPMLLILTFMTGCLSQSDSEDSASITLQSKKHDDSYRVTVEQVDGKRMKLGSIKYQLSQAAGHDETGIVGLVVKNSKWEGIDVTWDGNAGGRTGTNGGEYSDTVQAQIRMDDVLSGFQAQKQYQKGEGTITVRFYDIDLNGIISKDDYFDVVTTRYVLPDHSYWLRLFDVDSNKEIGSTRLWTKVTMPIAPVMVLKSHDATNGSYQVQIIGISHDFNLSSYKFYLMNSNNVSQQSGEIALQNISGVWHGVDVTWDDDGDNDINPGNNKADRAESANGSYSDTTQAQIRIDDVQAGSQSNKDHQKSEGTISVSFFDDDTNGKLTKGDYFYVRGNEPQHQADDSWQMVIQHDITNEVCGRIVLIDD